MRKGRRKKFKVINTQQARGSGERKKVINEKWNTIEKYTGKGR